jgi:ribonuclease P protein component
VPKRPYETEDEADFPTQQSQAQEDPWFPRAHEDSRRSRHPHPPAGQGPGPALRLSQRLPSKRVREVLASGRRTIGDHVVVFVAPGTGGVAYVAGRKVGGAVQRNRSRRVLRAAWAAARDHAHEEVDVVLVARRAILSTGSTQVALEIAALLGGPQSRPA